ncbi:AcvB/VirJ family lysyl-phosphatidylglycerol hydrolase [Pseudomonas sp. DC3000-4b1]|uniref:virulence factor family protein n=1 Tax=unclassified Pseudomonas TaxID=196821 RepID=UPI003CFB0498
MIRRYWRSALIALLILIVAAGLMFWWLNRPVPPATAQPLKLSDGSDATLVTPGQRVKVVMAVAVPADQALTQLQLTDLSRSGAARILQVTLPKDDCIAQGKAFEAALAQLDARPDIVGGIGPGASLAWQWLAGQDNDKARAVSVDFTVEQPGCKREVPKSAPHGKWSVAWNDWPDDVSASFVRGQANAQNSISDYDVKLPQLLKTQLAQAILGDDHKGLKMPVVEVPSKPNDTVTLFLSGDGGWRDLDKEVAEDMAKSGYPVVGIDTLRYYWQHKSPEESAEDLMELMQYYRQKWGAKRFVLAGYSFGADVLPAIYNRLPAADQARVDSMILLAFARSGSFEIQVEGWLGQEGKEAPTGVELAKVPGAKVLCVYGAEEADESGCTEATHTGEKLQLPGGHHFDENYPALAQRLIQAINQRKGS